MHGALAFSAALLALGLASLFVAQARADLPEGIHAEYALFTGTIGTDVPTTIEGATLETTGGIGTNATLEIDRLIPSSIIGDGQIRLQIETFDTAFENSDSGIGCEASSSQRVAACVAAQEFRVTVSLDDSDSFTLVEGEALDLHLSALSDSDSSSISLPYIAGANFCVAATENPNDPPTCDETEGGGILGDFDGSEAEASYTINLKLYRNQEYYLRGTLNILPFTPLTNYEDIAGTGLENRLLEMVNLRLVETNAGIPIDEDHIVTGSIGFTQTFVVTDDEQLPVLGFIEEELLPSGQWVPYDGEWTNNIVRVSVTCEDTGGSGIRHRPARYQYWVDNDQELVIPANSYGDALGTECIDRAGNRALPSPAEDIVVLVDRTKPTCNVTPNATSLHDTNTMQQVKLKLGVADGNLSPSFVESRLTGISGNDKAKPSDWTGWSIGTSPADTKGQFLADRKKLATRVYTLTYEVTDRAGNTGSCSAQVKVKN